MAAQQAKTAGFDVLYLSGAPMVAVIRSRHHHRSFITRGEQGAG
jgi:2-methylisocitrate lyase-like PEP mutase family enzyme